MTDSPQPKSYRPSGTNTLLLGATGTGKTYCLRTLVEAGVTPFILATEPGIPSTLGDLPPEQCHWKYIAPSNPDWDTLLSSAKKINTMSYKALAGQEEMDKRKYGQFLEVITTCNDFVCDRTGESYGDVSTWGPDRAFVIDSLTGLGIMAMNMVVGSKPTKSKSDWMMAMDNLDRFLQKVVSDTDCFFVLIGHLERQQDEVTGSTQLMASTLGRKLAPRLPRFFDDVIHCIRDGASWNWSTATRNVDLKTRNLPVQDKLIPSFVPLVEAWKAKSGQ